MSTTLSSASESSGNSGASSSAQPNASIEDGVLQIATTGQGSDITYALQPLVENSPLKDQPYIFDYAQQYQDRRALPVLSIRYRAEHPQPSQHRERLDASITRQSEVRTTLWAAYYQLVPNVSGADRPPRVVLHTEMTSSGNLIENITMNFGDVEKFETFRRSATSIAFDEGAGYKQVYAQDAFTITLSGRIFVFECQNLPLKGINTAALYDSFKGMASRLGVLDGMAQPTWASTRWSASGNIGLVRCYVRLHRTNMATDYQQLVTTSLPTHFKWHGIAYPLIYPGSHLHTKVSHSADYPKASPTAASANGTADTASAAEKQKTGN